MLKPLPLTVAALAVSLLGFSCSNSGRAVLSVTPTEAKNGETNQRTLTGLVLMSGGGGVGGVKVTVGAATGGAPARIVSPGLAAAVSFASGSESATTDPSGNFIALDPPAGSQDILFDPSELGGSLGGVQRREEIDPGGPTDMDRPVPLPCLEAPGSANADVVLTPTGQSNTGTATTLAAGDLTLTIPSVAVFQVEGVPATGTISLDVVPVPASELTEQLPFGVGLGGASVLQPTGGAAPCNGPLDGTSFVTVLPANLSFATTGGQPLPVEITIANDRGFLNGEMVHIYRFDEGANAWEDTGFDGVVEGSRVRATAVTQGGIYTAVRCTETTLATTVSGTVVYTDENGVDQPMPGVYVSTSLGQFAQTAANGTFRILDVPAYDPAEAARTGTWAPPVDAVGSSTVPFQAGFPLLVGFVAPVRFGGVSTSVGVNVQNGAAPAIVPGGETVLGTVRFSNVSPTGSVVGTVLENGVPPTSPTQVTIAGPGGAAPLTLTPDANGRFFVVGLGPGGYTAFYTFTGNAQPSAFTFGIRANEITTIAVQGTTTQLVPTSAGSNVTVRVLFDHDDDPRTPPRRPGGAVLTLFGTDLLSRNGITGFTNLDGEAFFDQVTGPFTVTAQFDTVLPVSPAATFRLASTVVGVQTATGEINIPLFGGGEDAIRLDAILSGTVTGLSGAQFSQVTVLARDRTNSGFFGSAPVDPITGAYSMSIPSGSAGILDVAVLEEDCTSGCVPSRAIVERGVGPVASAGQTLTRNYDLANGFAFDQRLDVTYTNPPARAGFVPAQVGTLSLRDAAGTGFDFALFASFAGLPSIQTSFQVPDPTDPALGGLTASFETNINLLSRQGPGPAAFCRRVIGSVPATIDVPFIGVPAVRSPVGAISAGQQQGLRVTFTEGSGGPGLPGLNIVKFGSDDAGLGPDRVQWLVFAPLGASSVTLPATSRPMFAAGSYQVDLETLRSAALPASYSQVFTTSLEQSLLSPGVFDECSTQVSSTLQVQ